MLVQNAEQALAGGAQALREHEDQLHQDLRAEERLLEHGALRDKGVDLRCEVRRVAEVLEMGKLRAAGHCGRLCQRAAHYLAARRRRTASASVSRSATESSQPRQGSVMLCPKRSAAPFWSSWRPSTRCDSTITPMMRRSPPAICAPMSRATSIWRRYSFAALACEQSIISRSGRPV